MDAPVELGFSSLQDKVNAVSIMKMTLDVELRTFLDEHRLSPSRPQLWAAELVESLQDINSEYRQRYSELIFGQVRMLRKLTAVADFDAKLQDMVQTESANDKELSKVEERYKHKRESMNAAQRSFFDNLLTTARESHAVTAQESAGVRAQFDEIRHLLEFLSQPQDELNVLMSSLPPFSTGDALLAAVTPAVETLAALSVEREQIVSRADAIEFQATQWVYVDVSLDERADVFALVAGLRNNLKAQRAKQSSALARITVETTSANGGPNSLPNFPGATWGAADLLYVATQYASLDRFMSMLEELQSQTRTGVDLALAKLS